MAELERAVRALENAHRAGDTEAAREIATAIKQMQASGGDGGAQAATESEGGEGPRGGIPFLNRGIANVLGAPADLAHSIAAGLGYEAQSRPLGSESIQSGMRSLSETSVPAPGAEPETMGEKVAGGFGEAAGALLPFGAAAKGMQAAGQLAPKVAGAGKSLMAPFVNTPVRAMAAETAAGGGFEAAQSIAEDQDASPLGQFAAGLAGSIGAAMGPGAAVRSVQTASKFVPGVAMAIRGVRGAIFPFTKAGGMDRASRRVRELSANPEADAARLDEPSIGNLTPAQQTGSDRLMALERAVLDKDAALDATAKQRTAESSAALREAVREPAQGMGAEQAQEFIGKRVEYLTSLLDQRVLQAEEAAKARLAKLTPERRASESATIARSELEAALKSARAQERQLWNAVPDDELVPTDNVTAAFDAIWKKLGRATKEDMPPIARRLLGRAEDAADDGHMGMELLRRVFGDELPVKNAPKDKFGTQETVLEMRELRSKLLGVSRNARRNGEFNTARIADDLSDAILDDLAELGDDSVDLARTFSNELNQRFRRGSIGRILGYAKEGGASVKPELTLDRTIGQPGLKAAVSADELRQAVGDSPDAEGAMRDYLRKRFQDAAVRNGELNPTAAQTFVRNNDELLDRFPDLKREMQAGQAAQVGAEQTTRTAGTRSKRLRDPKQSRTAEFLKADPEKAIETAIKDRDPRTAARNLRQLVRKDESGEALAGLKGSLFDHLIAQAKTGQFDEAGEAILSGRKLQALLRDKKTRAAATELLTTEEFGRLDKIAQELRKLETSQGRLPSVGAPMQDLPNTILDYVGRVFAARAGAKAGAGSSGASLLTASFASKRMKRILERLTNDQAEVLIRDAIQDKELFQTLLMGVDTPRKAKRVERRLVEWLEGYTGTQVGEANEERAPLRVELNAGERDALMGGR